MRGPSEDLEVGDRTGNSLDLDVVDGLRIGSDGLVTAFFAKAMRASIQVIISFK